MEKERKKLGSLKSVRDETVETVNYKKILTRLYPVVNVILIFYVMWEECKV